jgi:hypothetical protein
MSLSSKFEQFDLLEKSSEKISFLRKIKDEESWDLFKSFVPEVFNFSSVIEIYQSSIHPNNFEQLFYFLDLYPDTDYTNILVQYFIASAFDKCDIDNFLDNIEIFFTQYSNYLEYYLLGNVLYNVIKINKKYPESISRLITILMSSCKIPYNMVQKQMPPYIFNRAIDVVDSKDVDTIKIIIDILQSYGFDPNEIVTKQKLIKILCDTDCAKISQYLSQILDPGYVAESLIAALSTTHRKILVACAKNGANITGILLEKNF